MGKITELKAQIKAIDSGSTQKAFEMIVEMLLDLGIKDALKAKEMENRMVATVLEDGTEEIIELTEVDNG